MCNRFGKCHKYTERTSYIMIASLVLLVAALGVFIRIVQLLLGGALVQGSLPELWGLLAIATVTAGLGVALAFVTVHRLR